MTHQCFLKKSFVLGKAANKLISFNLFGKILKNQTKPKNIFEEKAPT